MGGLSFGAGSSTSLPTSGSLQDVAMLMDRVEEVEPLHLESTRLRSERPEGRRR